jgi:hypothetical protein
MAGSHHLLSHLGLVLLLIFGTAMANEVAPPTVAGATSMGAPPIEEPSMVAGGEGLPTIASIILPRRDISSHNGTTHTTNFVSNY